MIFVFADCEIDIAKRELRRDGRVVHVEPQVFDVLVHLVKCRDRVVGKDELFQAVWRGRIVSEDTLTSRISAARRAIGDSGTRQSRLRTVARRIPARAIMAGGDERLAGAANRRPAGRAACGLSIPTLTEIATDVSARVRAQYEENPYPRWTKLPPVGKPHTADAFIYNKFPYSPFTGLGKSGGVDILVAGSGTGQHPIDAARKFKAAQVLAIDLSLASLSYAQRQTRALGLDNIRYAQADIMKLPAIDRTFDIVESVGVLHHLADPFAGWRALLSMLRPRGIMLIGLYSETARRGIVAAREFIAKRGYRPNNDDIRRCRQEILDCADGTPLKNVTSMTDFFSISECRDLLFHVQEHRLNLPDIAAFLAETNLQFLGFELDPPIRQKYARRFPNDIALTDLAQWHRYEIDNPHTFINMYQFWVQKQ